MRFSKLKSLIYKAVSNRIAHNAGWLMLSKIVQMLINLLVVALTTRFLGPANYGLISYAGAYTAFASPICALGIHSVVLRDLLSDAKEGMMLGTSLALRMIASLCSIFAIIGVSAIVDAEEALTRQIVILCSIALFFQSFEIFEYWFQAKLQSKTTAVVTLIAHIITSVYKIFLLATEKPVPYFAVATSLDYAVIAILLYVSYRKGNGEKLSFSLSYAKSLIKGGHHYIFSGLMGAIYAQTDKIMLKHMINETELGFYSTATSLCGMWCFVLSAITTSMYPVIVEAYNRSKAEFDRKNKMQYAIVFYISVGVSCVFTLFGSIIIKILYGEAYLPAAEPLRIITWYTGFSYLGVARDVWIVCMNRQKYLKYIYAASAGVNVVLNLLLIPGMGASGAAVASLIAQISTIVVPFFIKEMRENVVLMGKAILFR